MVYLGPDKIEADMPKRKVYINTYKSTALLKQHGNCKYCFAPLSRKRSTADHVIPISRGGTNNKENIVAACCLCNSIKGSMSATEFKRLLNTSVKATDSVALIQCKLSKRIWRKTHKAKQTILASVGISYTYLETPLSSL